MGGSSAYAVTQLDSNSVKSTHIVNEQVKGLDVRDNSLTKDDILDHSLEQDAYGSFHDAPVSVRKDLNTPTDNPVAGEDSVLSLSFRQAAT